MVLFGLSLVSNVSYSQVKSKSVSKSVQEFSKKKMDTLYVFTDNIIVSNGKGDKVKKKFTLFVPISVWEYQIKNDTNFTGCKESKLSNRSLVEKHYMDFIVNVISIHAKYMCKNSLSFEPLNDNTVIWLEDKFISSYKCMARNGYGNMVETSIMSDYVPNYMD